MMVCMAGLQVFIVQFFFKVCFFCDIGNDLVYLIGSFNTNCIHRVPEKDTCEERKRRGWVWMFGEVFGGTFEERENTWLRGVGDLCSFIAGPF